MDIFEKSRFLVVSRDFDRKIIFFELQDYLGLFGRQHWDHINGPP
jgi:hypothetical protein